ncbi:PREDICTED: RNA exonuclease 4 [Nanorana parkeri]|uniref:RNA exonuclease 4 n=1 Tax=Nanorana parkeri TaxID=125878 RepID=UPI00085480EB|nr:PREDICTED: RNA exonuclease 4 [Nanorana parkeri]
MGKIVVKKDKPSSEGLEKNKLQHTKKQKKKKYWKEHPKIVTKQVEIKKISPFLPPKKAEEFSANWKALQALLTSEKKDSVTESTSTKASKKEKKLPKLEKQKAVPVIKDPASSIPTIKKGPTADQKPKRAAEDAGTTDKIREKRRKLQAEGEKKPSKNHNKKPTEMNIQETPKLDLWFDDVDPDDVEAALGAEAGQIARKMQGLPEKKSHTVDMILVKDRAFEGLTRTVAIDCEMVGVGTDGEESMVARVSIVNQFGKCIYDKHVKPTERVTDYRTEVSGIRPGDIKNGEDFKVVQKEVSEILKGRILVGHALHNDLKILFLDHPKKAIRDTQKYKPFRREVQSGRPSLKQLCEKILSVKVQTGEHSSVQDAQAAMRLYTMEKKNWEASIKGKYNKTKVEPQKRKPSSLE